MLQVPHIDVVGSGRELAMIPSAEDTCPNKDGAPAATLGGNAKEKDALAILSSWEKIATLLKAVPCFTVPELLAFGVEEFFSFSHCHFVNLCDDPCMARVVRPSHVTSDFALRCTYPLLKYTIEETTKMLRFIPLLPKFAESFGSDTWFDVVSASGCHP